MLLEKIYLHQFRNYLDTKVDISPKITLLVGQNGHGKTNLLEAIFCLVFGKSFRDKKTDDIISWGYDEGFLQAKIYIHKTSKKFEVDFVKEGKIKKIQKIQDVPVKNIEYIGQFNAVLFQPEDLNMIDHEPSLRRRYLDMLLSQVDAQYVYNLGKYGKVLKMRNKVLSQIKERKSDKDELVFWNKNLIEYGSYIIRKRISLLEFMNERSPKLYSEISGEDSIFTVSYNTFYKDIHTLEEEYEKMLISKYEYDLMTGSTNIGPHRDDLEWYLNTKQLKTFASRGEYRSAVLVLKMLEVEYIKEKTRHLPILLLDDVFSELDEKRKTYLLDMIQKQQTIVTTTHLGDLENIVKNKKDVLIYSVQEGKLKKYTYRRK